MISAKRFIPKWTTLRGLGNSPAARLSILVPIIGYWILFNNHLMFYVNLVEEIGGKSPSNSEPHVPWQLFWTYFGLIFVGAASTVYQWRCPPQIKAYVTATNYVKDVFAVLGNVDCLNIMAVIETGDELSKKAVADIKDYAPLKNQIGTDVVEKTAARIRDVKADVLHIHFAYLDRSDWLSRTMVGILYFIGLGSLLVPTINVLMRVTVLLYSSRLT